MARVAFVMEQHLGHQTYFENVRRYVAADSQITPSWVPVTYRDATSVWNRLPLLPESIRGTLRGQAEVSQGLRHTRFDAVFFNTQVPAVLAGALVRRQPYLVATDLTPIQYDQLGQHYGHQPDLQGPLAWYKHRCNVAVFRQAACLLPWSSWARDSMIADYGVAPERIVVLPPGVDLDRWQPANQQDEPDPLRILFVGGDLWRKGGDMLLRVFQSLPAGSAELHLVTRSAVPQIAGVSVYHDMRPNSSALIALFRRSHVFVLPTHAEAFGIAAAEASACGLATIATRVGGLPDIVVDGQTGFLIQPGDAGALRERLLLMLSERDRCLRMGRAARERAEQCFDARRNAQQIVFQLQNAIGKLAEAYYAT